jgi:hypothetical protein
MPDLFKIKYVVSLVRGAADQRSSQGRRGRTAIEAYAKSRGWLDIDYREVQTGQALLDGPEPDALGPVFRALSPGTIAITTGPRSYWPSCPASWGLAR